MLIVEQLPLMNLIGTILSKEIHRYTAIGVRQISLGVLPIPSLNSLRTALRRFSLVKIKVPARPDPGFQRHIPVGDPTIDNR